MDETSPWSDSGLAGPAATDHPRVGCAGFTLPGSAALFPPGPSPLARYAMRFDAIEINTSFYGPPRPSTWERWAEEVPDGFRFAAKLPRQITHLRRLTGASDLLAQFLTDFSILGPHRGPLLVQLPPTLRFDARVAGAFLADLRDLTAGAVAFEPRHPSWLRGEADVLLASFAVARVAADPSPAPGAEEPGGWNGLAYWRQHGSPQRYVSPYGDERLRFLAARLESCPGESWCIFDNTAAGAAVPNAIELISLLSAARR